MKKILITGASGGIGSSIVDKFLKNKYTIILTSSSDTTLTKLKQKYGDSHHYYVLDFKNPDENNIILKKISEEHQDLNVIVNNAGITDDSLLLRMKTDQWNNVIQANLSSNFTIIKALLPNMIKNKSGNIIGVSSVVATSLMFSKLEIISEHISLKILVNDSGYRYTIPLHIESNTEYICSFVRKKSQELFRLTTCTISDTTVLQRLHLIAEVDSFFPVDDFFVDDPINLST